MSRNSRVPEAPTRLRAAERGDTPALVELIGELAAFENLTHLLTVTEARLSQGLFGTPPCVECVVAEREHEMVAFALFFTNFSTFLGKPGMYLEDLYVRPAHRGQGIGKRLLSQLAAIAVERDYGRFEWSVLDWNRTAIGFYERAGAKVLPDWRICRLTGGALRALAAQRDG